MTFNLYYFLGRSLIRLYAGLLLKMQVRNQTNLPQGPKIFVANHPSATDPFLIHLVSPQPLSVLITYKAFQTPLLGWYLQKIGQIPVPAEQGHVALVHACHALQMGRSVGIFIEGAISPQEGGFHPPRTGAVRLALMTGAPIVPVGIYLHREWNYRIASRVSGIPSVGYWYLFGPYAITIGQPIVLDGKVEDRAFVRAATDRIMTEIQSLAWESARRVRPLRFAPAPIQTR